VPEETESQRRVSKTSKEEIAEKGPILVKRRSSIVDSYNKENLNSKPC
jgi:hypothetical protein